MKGETDRFFSRHESTREHKTTKKIVKIQKGASNIKNTLTYSFKLFWADASNPFEIISLIQAIKNSQPLPLEIRVTEHRKNHRLCSSRQHITWFLSHERG